MILVILTMITEQLAGGLVETKSVLAKLVHQHHALGRGDTLRIGDQIRNLRKLYWHTASANGLRLHREQYGLRVRVVSKYLDHILH